MKLTIKLIEAIARFKGLSYEYTTGGSYLTKYFVAYEPTKTGISYKYAYYIIGDSVCSRYDIQKEIQGKMILNFWLFRENVLLLIDERK